MHTAAALTCYKSLEAMRRNFRRVLVVSNHRNAVFEGVSSFFESSEDYFHRITNSNQYIIHFPKTDNYPEFDIIFIDPATNADKLKGYRAETIIVDGKLSDYPMDFLNEVIVPMASVAHDPIARSVIHQYFKVFNESWITRERPEIICSDEN